MKTKIFSLGAGLALALAVAIVPATKVVHAEIDTGILSASIWQNGRVVGEIYRSDTDPTRYTEHWVLYPDYVYPSSQNGIATQIKPGYRAYRGTNHFLANVPFGKGSRYVKTSVTDGTALPTLK